MKNYSKRMLVILASMLIMAFTGCGDNNILGTSPKPEATAEATNPAEESQTEEPEKTAEIQEDTTESTLEVHFLDVGQGDSILLISDDKTMLIDAGDNSYGKGVVSYIQNLGISKIDYVIGTHPDADHIGGLDNVISSFDIGKIYMPKKQSNTKTFEDVLTAVSDKGLKISSPNVGDTFTLGSATVTIIAPIRTYNDNNDNSIVMKVIHGKNSFLFTGDAELEAEEDIVASGADLKATVLKVGHHGSSTSTSQALLEKVDPEYAVISCGRNNKYGHPHTETLTYLERANVTIYRTDEQNTIIMNSDGNTITTTTNGPSIETSSSSQTSSTTDSNVESEEVKAEATPEATSSTVEAEAYIGNKNSKKYHRTTCSSLPAEKNRVSFSTKEEAEAAGYEGCQVCNP